MLDPLESPDEIIAEKHLGRMIKCAIQYRRHFPNLADPRECPLCGKGWPTIERAVECCTPMGVAIAEALDCLEFSERHGVFPPGTTAIMESEFCDQSSEYRDELLSRYEASEKAVGYGRPDFTDWVRAFGFSLLPMSEQIRWEKIRRQGREKHQRATQKRRKERYERERDARRAERDRLDLPPPPGFDPEFDRRVQ